MLRIEREVHAGVLRARSLCRNCRHCCSCAFTVTADVATTARSLAVLCFLQKDCTFDGSPALQLYAGYTDLLTLFEQYALLQLRICIRACTALPQCLLPFSVLLLAPPKTPETERDKMEICVKSFDGEKYTVEVGVDDTTADIRRKVATAAELCEDGFDMSFGGKLLAEGDDTTQLSAGDTVVLKKMLSQKDDAIAALRDLGETRLTTDRLYGLTDPKLVHLFLQAEVVTEIPDTFLQGSPYEELYLSGVPGVTKIGSNFLRGCTSLHTAEGTKT